LKTDTGNSFVSSFINCRLLPEASDTPQNLIPRRKRRPSDQLRRSSLDGGTGGHTRRRRTLALEMLLLLLLRSKNAGQGATLRGRRYCCRWTFQRLALRSMDAGTDDIPRQVRPALASDSPLGI
jgi:hypothetical protein